ncbi:MAG: hypothetical protein GC160_07815 [Acidobacteria bacterium]|nr:hypothetical protein [Acidobacteriota bacterium]
MRPPEPRPAGGVRRCPQCMTQVAGDARFCGVCGSAFDAKAAAPGDPDPGALLAERYELGLALGETPYGRAFIAWDRVDGDKRVVLAAAGPEVFASELADPATADEATRSLLASRSGARVTPTAGAATALDVLWVNERLALVFDEPSGRALLGAMTLLDALDARERPPEPREAVALLAPAAQALQAFHEAGRVHGRVSPQSVSIAPGAPAALLDLPALQPTRDGESRRVAPLLDRPYAPPELLGGKPAGVTADVYGLAATLFRVLTGRAPEGRSTADLLTDLRQVGAPSAMAEAVRQALSPSPSGRFSAVEPFWRALESSFVTPPTAQWPRMAAAVLAVLLIVAGGVWLGLEYGPEMVAQVQALIQGGPKVSLQGPEPPVAPGTDVELRWDAPADSQVTLDGNPVAPSGTTVIPAIQENRTFALQATLADGSVVDRTFEVQVGAAAGAIEIVFEGPTEPVAYEGSARLSWTVRGAASVKLDGRAVDPSGSYLASGLTANEEHTLEALAADGTRESRTVSIQVLPGSVSPSGPGTIPGPGSGSGPTPGPGPGPSPGPGSGTKPTPKPPMVLSFVPSTLSAPYDGAVELQWEAVNAKSVELDGAAVPAKGSRRVSGLRADRSFVLTAVGLDGTRQEKRLTVSVTAPGAPSISAFRAEPDSVLAGAPVTLRWQVSGDVSSLAIKPGGAVSGASGTLQVRPDRTTTYELTATGPGGKTSATTVVTIRAGAPTITFEARPPTVSCTGASQLSWNVRDATEVSIEPEPGAVATSGTARVKPGRERTYTLTAKGPGGVAYKETTVRVAYDGPSTGVISINEKLQSGVSLAVAGFPCVPVDITVQGDPLNLLQPPSARGGEWVAYFTSPRSGVREVKSQIRWTVR